jgi:hypothetical protein
MSNRIAFALMLLVTLPVWAHQLHLDWQLRSGQIEMTAYYDDDTPADEADVRLLDAAGTLIGTTKTDERGMAYLPIPKEGTYRLEVKHIGHRASWELHFDPVGEVSEPRNESEHLVPHLALWQRLLLGFGIIFGFFGSLKLFYRWKKRNRNE